MSHVMPGRYTAEIGPQGAVVFLIGMRFNRWWQVDRGAVGIWHETYAVTPGHQESVNVNMPRFGLAAATWHVPVGAAMGSARARLRPRGTGDQALPG